MFKYYVLVSGSLNCLSRHFFTLQRSDVVVVINTLDKEFEERAYNWCTKNDIECYITKSDGTAATGKNSVIDLFLESDNEYMVQVDGDDIITKYGRNLYRTIAQSDNPPDILCLSNQLSLARYDGEEFDDQVDSTLVKKSYMPSKRLNPCLPHNKDFDFTVIKDHMNLSRTMKESWYVETDDEARKLSAARIEIDLVAQRHGQSKETFNRIVFYSRKGASFTLFDNTLHIGEDTVQYYKLKKLAYDGLIDMKLYDENWGRTYLYMEDTEGVVSMNLNVSKEELKEQKRNHWNWLVPLRDELNRIKDNLPINFQLEYIDEPYYEVNKE